MKKYLLLSLILFITGCKEANEIFGEDEYWMRDDVFITVTEDGTEKHFDGPVYVSATNWGSMAYVSDVYVNIGCKLLISESSDAEGGIAIDVTSNAIAISDLRANTQYYYCLYLPSALIKSEIKKVVVPDVSAVNMSIEQRNDSVFCTIEDSIPPSFIKEKGFRIPGIFHGSGYDKEFAAHVVEGNEFSISIPEIIEKYSIWVTSFSVYAYVQTANTYYRTREEDIYIASSSIESDSISKKVNTEKIKMSGISEETRENVDYLKCTITGYTNDVWFNQGDRSYYDEERLMPDFSITDETGMVTTYYIKKQPFYNGISCYASYRIYEDDTKESYRTDYLKTASYISTVFNVRTLDEFLGIYGGSRYTCYTYHLLNDITIPEDYRLCLRWENVILEGNGHKIDGISYFPLFREIENTTIKNLKIGTDSTIYSVKKGTCSYSSAISETPLFLLSESSFSDYGGTTFENCEIRGTIQVSGRDDFYVSRDYCFYWWEEDKIAGTFEDHIVRVSGLKDYTKTEFK